MMKKLLLVLISTSILFACSKDKDPEPTVTIDAPTIELKYDKDHQFALKKGSEGVFASTFTWASSNEKVGKVDANGKVTARKIGEATITGTGSNGAKVESKITVSPYVTIFTEPILEFGASMATIKSKEKRKLLAEKLMGSRMRELLELRQGALSTYSKMANYRRPGCYSITPLRLSRHRLRLLKKDILIGRPKTARSLSSMMRGPSV